MADYKVNFKRNKLTDDEVSKGMDFNAFIAGRTVVPWHTLKGIKILLIVGAVVVAIVGIILSIPKPASIEKGKFISSSLDSIRIEPAIDAIHSTEDTMVVNKTAGSVLETPAPGSVSNSKNTYTVFPSDSVVWGEKANLVRVRVKGACPFSVSYDGGRISGKDSVYIIQVDSSVSGLLTICEMSEGKSKVVFTKPYKVNRIPPPYVLVCGVKTDSVIDKQQLINDNKVMAYSTYHKMHLKVLSFDMIYVNAGKFDTLSATTNHFTLEMRRRIMVLKPGNILYFENVKCVMPDRKIVALAPIQIFINETDKYKIGSRIISR